MNEMTNSNPFPPNRLLRKEIQKLLYTPHSCSAATISLKSLDASSLLSRIELKMCMLSGSYRGAHFVFYIDPQVSSRGELMFNIWADQPIFHPNIDERTGKVSLASFWEIKDSVGVIKAMQMIMTNPAIDDQVNISASSMLSRSKAEFEMFVSQTLDGYRINDCHNNEVHYPSMRDLYCPNCVIPHEYTAPPLGGNTYRVGCRPSSQYPDYLQYGDYNGGGFRSRNNNIICSSSSSSSISSSYNYLGKNVSSPVLMAVSETTKSSSLNASPHHLFQGSSYSDTTHYAFGGVVNKRNLLERDCPPTADISELSPSGVVWIGSSSSGSSGGGHTKNSCFNNNSNSNSSKAFWVKDDKQLSKESKYDESTDQYSFIKKKAFKSDIDIKSFNCTETDSLPTIAYKDDLRHGCLVLVQSNFTMDQD